MITITKILKNICIETTFFQGLITISKSFNKEYITTFNPIITSSVIVKKDILDKLEWF